MDAKDPKAARRSMLGWLTAAAEALGTCMIVEGAISPNGWCIEFQAKPQKKG